MKYIVILSTTWMLIACGNAGNPSPPSDKSILPEQIEQLQALKNSVKLWAVTCEHNDISYACEEYSDGDSMLFMGLLCLSGETSQCDAIPYAQDDDGRMWRAPSKKSWPKGSFSRDMLLGVLSYLYKTKDTHLARQLLSFIENNNYKLCDETVDDRCNFHPLVYRMVWGIIGRVWDHIGLNKNAWMIQADLGDDTLINGGSNFAPEGFTLHLMGVEILLRQKLNTNTTSLIRAARALANRQSANPFFEYLAHGKTRRAAELTMTQCLFEKPIIANQWAWQRDQNEEAWKHSMGWDCIFMVNLLSE